MTETFDTLPIRPVLKTLTIPPRAAPPPPGRNAPLARMHFNEGWWGPSPEVAQALSAAISGGLNRYHESYWTKLAGAIAARCGVAEDRIVCGNGSIELIALASQAFLEPGRSAVLAWPTFPRLRSNAVIVGAEAKAVPVRPDGGSDIEAMLNAVDGTTTLAWLTTPNNPTGMSATAEEIAELADELPSAVILGVDEAYGEFARARGGPDALEILRGRARPWFVMRTFSKAYGLAGLRVGYLVASSPALADCFHRLRSTFNIPGLSQIGAAAAFADEAYMKMRVADCVAERERLRATLAGMGLACLPSDANFLAIDAGTDGLALVQTLRNTHGILVSAIKAPGFEKYIRVTLGSAEQNDAFAKALSLSLKPAA
jgi:histidinol-phosphate aminotransferase